VFEESINTEVSSSEFVDKQWLYVNDNNNGSYSGQIVLDTTSLSNSGSYINWSEAFIAIPLVLQAEGSATAITASNGLDYLMGLKNGFWQILHSMSVEFNNGSIIQQTPFLNVFCSFKNLTSWSQNDIQNWGAVCGFCPDTARSWLYNNNSTANSLFNFMNTSGQGFCNNRTCPYVSISTYGYWSGAFVSAGATPNITGITTASGLLLPGMVISGAGITMGTYVVSVNYTAATAVLSVNIAAAVVNTTPMFGASPLLSYQPDTTCGDDSDNIRSLHNAGLAQRISWLNFSLSNLGSAVVPTMTNSLTSNQSSLLAGSSGTTTTSVSSNSALNQIFQSYVQKASTTRAIIFDAVIRLKDIADFFQKCPLLKGSTMRIYLNTNQVYFTIGVTNGIVPGSVSTTALSAGASTAQTQTGVIALTSTPVILGGGGTNPVMVSSMDIGQGAYNLVPLAQTIAATPESVKIGLSIVRTQFKSGQFTGDGIAAPVTSVRLYAPAYTMSPIAEQRYLSLTPTKKIVYNDLFQYSFTGVTSGQTFSFLVTNGIPNIRGILVIPLLPKASNGVASTYPTTTTALAGVTTSTLLSPFATTGGTPDPVSISNFQIQISGKNLFINNLQYDYETFYEQLVSSNQLNGSLTTSLSSGLIGFSEFEHLYRYYYGNAGRSIPSEDGVAKAVQVSGVNNSPNTIDFMVFIEFERQIVVDVRTGARVQ